jgi:hypothetical protein
VSLDWLHAWTNSLQRNRVLNNVTRSEVHNSEREKVVAENCDASRTCTGPCRALLKPPVLASFFSAGLAPSVLFSPFIPPPPLDAARYEKG